MSVAAIALFFMYRQMGGGTTSYTVHLCQSIRRAGMSCNIYRVKERGEKNERPFAKYDGITYRNIDPDEALTIARQRPSLMTAPCNSKFLQFDPEIIGKLMKAGMRIVIHDPNEFEIYDHLNNKGSVVRPLCIRPSMQTHFKDAIFIPHPYVREFDDVVARKKTKHAVSIARVTFVKRTELILEANRSLAEEMRIVLRGAENRLYTRFKIMPRFKEYKQGNTGFPMVWGASARECEPYKFAVDMTWFPDDGGGSQYSFMEAWDAGAVNVIPKDWMRYKGEMEPGVNCLAVDGADELAAVIRSGWKMNTRHLVEAGYKMLERHDPVRVGRAYIKELTR